MKHLMETRDTCCFCNKPATKTSTIKLDYMGMEFPLVAALCKKCHALPNRDHLLRRYVDGIFGTDAENRVTG